MRITCNNEANWSAQDYQADTLVVQIYAGSMHTQLSGLLPEHAVPVVLDIVSLGDFNAEIGEHLTLYHIPSVSAKRLILCGVGQAEKLTPKRFRKAVAQTWNSVAKLNTNKVTWLVPEKSVPSLSWQLTVKLLVNTLYQSSYQFRNYKTNPKPATKVTHIELLSLANNEHAAALVDICAQEYAIDSGKRLTRDLANAAANDCTPTHFVSQAQQLAQQYPSITTEIIDEPHMAQLGMGAYLAVSQGSSQPAYMSVLHYRQHPIADTPPIVLIGKGVTFDSGGITIKGADGMQNMIYDMGGAAAVMGCMQAVAELNLPLNVIGIVAGVENMPDGAAYRPGDVLTSMSGQTIEVISTDAEGRLVLCDAITYSRRFNPEVVIDMATLTGAAIITLGSVASGLMSNDSRLARALTEAGEQALDPVWEVPIWDEYQDALDSTCADMRNSGTKSPGMITAGCFLSRFTKGLTWAHLDIAGTSFQYGKGNSASGRPIDLLIQYLLNSCK